MIVVSVLRGHPRLIAATCCGLLAAPLLPRTFLPLTRALSAWDIGCLVFLILSADLFTRQRDRDIARDARAQEEGEWTIFALTVCAAFASFAAILGEFSAGKDAPAALRDLRTGLVALTLLLSWLMTHTVFALRYAHEYYGTTGKSTAIDKGLEFPGGQLPDYWDFFYFALVLGMTFQVSDVQISSRKLRRLATAQGLLGFLFNTVILALSVNIGASLM